MPWQTSMASRDLRVGPNLAALARGRSRRSSWPEIAGVKATTLIVAGDADIFPPAHAVEMVGLLGGEKRDGGWDGSGVPNRASATSQ